MVTLKLFRKLHARFRGRHYQSNLSLAKHELHIFQASPNQMWFLLSPMSAAAFNGLRLCFCTVPIAARAEMRVGGQNASGFFCSCTKKFRLCLREVAALLCHIRHVCCLRACEKMSRLTAQSVVAPMTNENPPVEIHTLQFLEQRSIDDEQLTVDPDVRPAVGRRARPIPASGRRVDDTPFFYDLHDCFHAGIVSVV